MSEIGNARRFMYSYSRAKRKLRLLESQVKELEDLIDIKGVHYDGVKTKGTPKPDKMAENIILLTERRKQVEDIRAVTVGLFCEITAAIDGLPDPKWKEVMTARYILGYKWDDAADYASAEISYAKRIHKKALMNIEERLKDKWAIGNPKNH